MTPEEKEQFIREGQHRLTALAQSVQQLNEWADAFSQRGGMSEFGNDAALVANLSGKVLNMLGPEDVATIARLRTDV